MSSRFQERKKTFTLRLRITARAESILRSGHPWLFAESIREQNRRGEIGELAVIYDRQDRFLALGLFDPDSPLRVRILHVGKPQTVNQSWWSARLEEALAKRKGLLDAQTSGVRWIHGESDGWPGLVLDQYETTLVLKLYTATWLPWLNQPCDLLQERLHPERIVLRLSRNIQNLAATQFARTDGQILWGAPLAGPVIFQESGLRFEADVRQGQKTGFFLDQRENRRRVETLARGRRVLNAFSFSGGFSLYAARGGARSVIDVDISPHALAAAQRNFVLNQAIATVAACRHETVQADVFDWLAGGKTKAGAKRATSGNPAEFDLIVLDPPSLAKRESERAGAIRAYGELTRLALGHLTDGGILVACSCSAHVTAEEFFEAVQRAAMRSGRDRRILQMTYHAPDHPASFPEANYLKAIYLEVKKAC